MAVPTLLCGNKHSMTNKRNLRAVRIGYITFLSSLKSCTLVDKNNL